MESRRNKESCSAANVCGGIGCVRDARVGRVKCAKCNRLRMEMDGRAESEGVAAVADAIDNLKRIRKSQ